MVVFLREEENGSVEKKKEKKIIKKAEIYDRGGFETWYLLACFREIT